MTGAASSPRSLLSSIVRGGGKTQHDVLYVCVLLTFLQSSSAVPSAPRTLIKLVKLSSRASWTLNEGGWYPVSGKEDSREQRVSFPGDTYLAHQSLAPKPHITFDPFLTPDLVKGPLRPFRALAPLLYIDSHGSLKTRTGLLAPLVSWHH